MSRESLSPREREHLGRALVSAFDRDHLERLVSYSLDKDLNAITEPGALEDVAFELVRWTIRNGRLTTLVDAAFEENAGNPELRRFRLDVWEAPASGLAAPTGGVDPSRPENLKEVDAAEVPLAGKTLGSSSPVSAPSRRHVVWAATGLAAAGGLAVLVRWLNDGGLNTRDNGGEIETPRPLPPAIVASPPVQILPTSGRLQFKQDLIPAGNSNRLGLALEPTYITVHETNNTNIGMDAEAHRRWAHDGSPGQPSFLPHGTHWFVDDREAIQVLPHNEIALHSGSDEANTSSIAATVCVASDLNQTHLYQNLVLLLAKIIRDNDIGDFDLSRVVQHNHWDPENPCPRIIRAQGLWETILGAVDQLV